MHTRGCMCRRAGVRKYALVAAFEDGRFAPIAVSEVKVCPQHLHAACVRHDTMLSWRCFK